MKGPLGVVADVLVADDWPFQTQADGRTLQFEFRGRTTTWPCFVRLHDDQIVIVYSQLPTRVPPERRAAIAELITRLNYALPLGNLELDLTDGEVRFRASIDSAGVELDPSLIRNLLHANVTVTDRCLPAIEAVAAGRSEPAAAVALAE